MSAKKEKQYSIDRERLIKDMETINNITATPNNGCTRFSYSEEDKRVRDYLSVEFDRLNLEVKVDGAGNIRAKYNPNSSDLPSVMVGSHIDTVPNGGEYDGLAGTISALEIIKTIQENNIEVSHPIELVIFAEEEGSNFGITTFGSKIMTGKITKDDLKEIYNSKGQSAYEIMEQFELDIESIGEDTIQSEELKAMIELHIEQGEILETEEKSVGVVTDIVGMNTYEVVLMGVSNHAGTTPMIGRKDPLVGAAQVILSMEDFARTQVNNTTVATVGKLDCEPSGSNIINNKVTFNVDIRDIEKPGINKASDHLKDKVKKVANEIGLNYTIKLIGTTEPARLSETVVNALVDKAENRGLGYLKLHSGAVHDTMMMLDVTNAAMIFVPSKDGISHSPKEYTSYEDIEDGANVLLETVIELGK